MRSSTSIPPTTHGFSSDNVSELRKQIVHNHGRRDPELQADNSFVRWGGGLRRQLIHHAEALIGVVVRDRKNLNPVQSSWTTTVVTRILRPIGYDGLLLPELCVLSRIGDYVAPRIKISVMGRSKPLKDAGQTA